MAKKAWIKKKAFRETCRRQVKAGLINDANGDWRPYNSANAMHRDQRSGYKIR